MKLPQVGMVSRQLLWRGCDLMLVGRLHGGENLSIPRVPHQFRDGPVAAVSQACEWLFPVL